MKKIFLLLVLGFGMNYLGWGQQVIGTFPQMDGGFGNQVTGTLVSTTIATGVTRADWTVQNTSGTGTITATGGRSSPKYASFSATAARRLQSPTTANQAVANATLYTIQFFYKSTAAASNGQVGVSPDGTTQPGSYISITLSNTSGVWTKMTQQATSGSSSNTPRYGIGIIRFSAASGATIDIDDFVMYQGTLDNTAPNSPGAVTVSNPTTSSLDISWIDASGGVDGGGYVVVRYESDPGSGNDPNQNGIYAVGNTIPTGGTVRYIGTGTSFTDNTGLSPNTPYWYKVYTVDKAFNYSTGSTGNGTTAASLTPTITVISSMTGFGSVTVNTYSSVQNYTVSGTNLTADIIITAPSGFQISTSNSPFTSSSPITLTQSGGTVDNTTIYVRFAPTVVQSYSGNITHTSTGATQQDLAVSGTGTSPSNPATFTAIPFSTTQINLAATANANGNDIVVVYNATGTFTTPTDGVAPGNVGDAFAGGTILYKGAAASLTNHTGLSPGQQVYYKAFSMDALYYYSSGSTANARTLKNAPTVQAYDINFTGVGNAIMTVNWTNGDGDRRIVKINTSNSFTDPVNGTPYTGNAVYSGSGEQVVYSGTGTNVLISGLTQLTTYWFRVYECNNSETNSVYLTSTAANNPNSQITTNQPFLEDFETGTKTSYTAGNVTCTMGSWNMTEALIGLSASDRKNGLQSVRMRYTNATTYGILTMNFDKTIGAGTVTVNHAKYGSDATSTWKLQMSIDHGTTWADIGSVITTSSTTLTPEVFTVNQPGNVRIKIVHLSGASSARINIDDIGITDFADPTTTTWTGSTSTEWNLNSNWSAGIPGTSSNVIIGTGTYQPVITSSITVNDLTINSGATLTIDAGKALTVNGNLTNNAGTTGLVIQSNTSGTGSLIHHTADVPATINRYITGSGSLTAMTYHLVSVPLTPATTSLSGLFHDSYLYEFNVSGNSWTNLGTSTTTPLDETKGYMVYYPGASNTYTFTGPMNAGSFTPYVTYAGSGFNLVPNPYPSAIDWSAASGWTKTNIDNATWIWPSGGGNYAAFVGGVGSFGGTQYIPAGQAFFVQANNSGPVLSMTDNVRVHNSLPFWKSEESIDNLLRIRADGNSYSDEVVVRFANGATQNLDSEFDAAKMYGLDEAPQLYTLMQDNGKLSINSLPLPTAQIAVPMNFELKANGNCSLTFTGMESFSSSATLYLEDKLAGKTVNLRQQNVYTFDHQSGNNAARFILHFNGVTGIDEMKADVNRMWISNATLYINAPGLAGKNARVEIYNLLGQKLYERSLTLNELTTLNPGVTGMVIVRVTSDTRVMTVKGILN